MSDVFRPGDIFIGRDDIDKRINHLESFCQMKGVSGDHVIGGESQVISFSRIAGHRKEVYVILRVILGAVSA